MIDPVMTGSQISTEYTAKTLSLQKSVMTEQGKNAVKLIQSAAILPEEQGQVLDLRG